MTKLGVPLALGIVLGVTLAVSATTYFETAADWTKLPDAFRNGYVAGAADMIRSFAEDIADTPLETNRDWARAAGQCLAQARYLQLSPVRAAVDAAVADYVTKGNGNYIPASILHRLAITCK